MRRLHIPFLCVVCQIGFWGPSGLGAPSWDIPAAALRLRIERVKDSAWPAEVGVVEVWPCGVSPLHYYVTLFNGTGQQIRSQTLWNEPHGSRTVLFDTSGQETNYYAYIDENPAPAGPPWKPESGVVVETRKCQKLPVNTWEQARKVLNLATAVSGRSLTPNIFLGTNPHGPSSFYTATFRGYFNATTAGEYGFATVSDGPSFLWVDGRIVTQWPGTHGAGEGRQAQHNGTIRLELGRHQMEYVHIHFDGAAAAVAAWKPPGQSQFEVMPPKAFVPVAQFQVAGAEPGSGNPATYFEWQNAAQSVMDDTQLIDVTFKIVEPKRGWTYRWFFDDGGQAEGANLRHCFARAGLRQVTLSSFANKQATSTNAVTVKVGPNWLQQEDWRREIFEPQKKELLTRDLSTSPRDDLIELVGFADRAQELDLLSHAGEACLKRQTEFLASHALIFYKIGFRLQHRNPDQTGTSLAEQALRLAASLSSANPALHEKVNLRLAEYLILGAGQTEEGLELLRGVGTHLAPEERRLAGLLKADALLASGNLAEARKLYIAATDKTENPEVKEELRRKARLQSGIDLLIRGQPADTRKMYVVPRDKIEEAEVKEELRRSARRQSAIDLIARGELAAGEEVIDRILWETPLERMSLEVNLPLIAIYVARQEYRRASATCHRLLAVGAEDTMREPQLLLALATADLALGQQTDGQNVLKKLLTFYPESEAAARAKEKWGTRSVTTVR